MIGGVLAVGVASAVIRLAGGGNALDRLIPLVLLVLVGGGSAGPLLRWLRSLRR